MHIRERARLFFTAGESDFEFSSEALCVGMSKHELRCSLGVWCYIEGLCVTDTGQRARRYVPDRVAAGLTSCNTYRRKPAHQIWRVVDVNEMQLEILTCSDVQNPVRVFLGEIRQSIQLDWSDAAEGNFDALHSGRIPERIRTFGHVAQERELLGSDTVMPVPIVIALAVTASTKSSFRKNLFVEFSGPPQRHLAFEGVDFHGDLRVHSVG